MSKLSRESGVSVPTIKEYFSVLEDTLVIERVGPYLKNARKRLLHTPRYYMFDMGVRNALARLPLGLDLVHAQKGVLFEHAVMLEIIHRSRSLGPDIRVCYWRTAGGAEVDCVLDCGDTAVPLEIKSSTRLSRSDTSGLRSFLHEYASCAPQGYLVYMGEHEQKLSANITAVPWNRL
jgi:predicted AAA+ superfamily ATPase